MKSQRGRYQIHQRRLIADLTIAEQFRIADVPAPPVRLHAAPIINPLEDVFTVFANFQFDHHQAPVMTEREQIDRTRAADSDRGAARSSELGVDWRDD